MKTIAFDLDGTLIDISERDYRIYSDILMGLSYSPIEKANYWPLRRDKTDIHRILGKSGCKKDEDVKQFLLKRKEKMEELFYLKMDKLFEDTMETLDSLSDEYNIVILTRRQVEANTRTQCEWLKLDQIADVRIVKGDKKEQMRAIQSLCVFVGDTENDIVPANELGVMSVAVTTGIRNKNQLEGLKPTVIVDSLNEILDLI